ncbi:hypothetical protein [Gilvimarinus japonicus]|uniref:Uncharacterized protein n=1 Tax=Gilvimarinus japonicus TaxID=1796469 RepID=A0ABV7HT57_9GAMM
MSESMIAWSIYLVGALLLVLFGWRIAKPLSRYAQWLFAVSIAVLLFTPFSLNLENHPAAYAPALFVAVLNSVFLGIEAGLDAAVTLALIWLVALVLTLVLLLLTRKRQRGTPAQAAREPSV